VHEGQGECGQVPVTDDFLRWEGAGSASSDTELAVGKAGQLGSMILEVADSV
jgi:hypothetical protein